MSCKVARLRAVGDDGVPAFSESRFLGFHHASETDPSRTSSGVCDQNPAVNCSPSVNVERLASNKGVAPYIIREPRQVSKSVCAFGRTFEFVWRQKLNAAFSQARAQSQKLPCNKTPKNASNTPHKKHVETHNQHPW